MNGTTIGPIHSPTGTTCTRPWPIALERVVVLRTHVEQRRLVGTGQGHDRLRPEARRVAGQGQGPDLGRTAGGRHPERGEVGALDPGPLRERYRPHAPDLLHRHALDARRA